MSDASRTFYLAAPLFSMAERLFNRRLKEAIENRAGGKLTVLLPQDFRFSGRYNAAATFKHLYQRCLDSLDSADLVIAILDGPDADSGTSFEVGYAKNRGIPIIGVRTDFREQQEKGLNLMLSRGVDDLVVQMSFDENLDMLAKTIVRRAEKFLK